MTAKQPVREVKGIASSNLSTPTHTVSILPQCQGQVAAVRNLEAVSHARARVCVCACVCMCVWLCVWLCVSQVVGRIFPLRRGLFEDYVANFWCVSSVAIKWKQVRLAAHMHCRVRCLIHTHTCTVLCDVSYTHTHMYCLVRRLIHTHTHMYCLV